MPYKRIMIAIDGSETAKHALVSAIELSKLLNANLGVVFIVDELPLAYLPGGGLVQIEPYAEEFGKDILEKAKQVTEKNALIAEFLLVKISPMGSKKISEKIVESAQSWKADLLVIGTHGRRGFNRIFLGSVAEETVRISTVPVLLIRSTENT